MVHRLPGAASEKVFGLERGFVSSSSSELLLRPKYNNHSTAPSTIFVRSFAAFSNLSIGVGKATSSHYLVANHHPLSFKPH